MVIKRKKSRKRRMKISGSSSVERERSARKKSLAKKSKRKINRYVSRRRFHDFFYLPYVRNIKHRTKSKRPSKKKCKSRIKKTEYCRKKENKEKCTRLIEYYCNKTIPSKNKYIYLRGIPNYIS